MLGKKPLKSLASLGLVLLALAGCSSNKLPSVGSDLSAYMQLGRDARGKIITTYKVGNPYEVAGKWYYPAEDYGYREEGIASWYGPGFHGKRTANGEVYDMNALTAAHKTLPMPSVVLVTNLENGRSMKLRINDRGPFVDDRIIDLSRRAAQMLDVERKGIARVRVELVPEDSLTLKNIALDARGQPPATEMPGVTAAPRDPVSVVNLAPPVPTPPVVLVTPPTPPVPSVGLVTPGLPRPSLPTPGLPTPSPTPSPTISSSALPPPPGIPTPSPTAVPTPMPGVQPSTVIAAVPTREMASGLYIQAGAFTDLSNARRLEAQLSGLGNVFVAAAEISGRVFHRVRIGPMPDRIVADQMLSEMMTQGYDGARIVEE